VQYTGSDFARSPAAREESRHADIREECPERSRWACSSTQLLSVTDSRVLLGDLPVDWEATRQNAPKPGERRLFSQRVQPMVGLMDRDRHAASCVPVRTLRARMKEVVPEFRRRMLAGDRSGLGNSPMAARDGTSWDADPPIRCGTACDGPKTRASQIPKNGFGTVSKRVGDRDGRDDLLGSPDGVERTHARHGAQVGRAGAKLVAFEPPSTSTSTTTTANISLCTSIRDLVRHRPLMVGAESVRHRFSGRRPIIRSITHAPGQTVARPQRLHWLASISPLPAATIFIAFRGLQAQAQPVAKVVPYGPPTTCNSVTYIAQMAVRPSGPTAGGRKALKSFLENP
jgi:hypothetical protein